MAYFSGATTTLEIFKHVFILFFFVNIYDLIIFRNVKRFRIQGTEDMGKEYKNPKHHIFGAIVGTAIGIIVAGLSAIYFEIYRIIFM